MMEVSAAFCLGPFLTFIHLNITVVFIHSGTDGTTLENLTLPKGKTALPHFSLP
jgi:hypothetical protein